MYSCISAMRTVTLPIRLHSSRRASLTLSLHAHPTSSLGGAACTLRRCLSTEQTGRPGLFEPKRIIAPQEYNRWMQLIPCAASGLSFGTIVAVPSLLGPLMCRAQGVVAQAPTDFTMGALLPYTTLPPMSAHSIALSPI